MNFSFDTRRRASAALNHFPWRHLLCGVAAISSSAAWGQDVPLPSREELTPAERTQQAVRAADSGFVGRLDAGPCPFAESELTLTLRNVEFAGLTAVNPQRLEPAWADLRDKSVPVASLCAIRDRAADILLEEGYLARVEIPPQEIQGGQVTLQVIEAHIASVEVAGVGGPAQRKVAEYFSQLEGLAPFDMDVVQRQILLAADVPGVRLSTNVRPSNAAPGAVELIVQVEHDLVNALVGAQNFGSESAGPWTLLARVDFNSLTGLGERTSLIVSSSADLKEQRVVQLLEEIRLGRDGLLIRGSIAFAEGEPGGAVEALELESESLVAQAELAYPLVRRRRHNLWLAGGGEFVDQSTDLFGGSARLIDDRLSVAFVRIDGDQRIPTSNGLVMQGSFGVELRKGLDLLAASDRGDALLSRVFADPQAWVFRGRGQTEFSLPSGFSVATSLTAQWAEEPLLAYEELSIGNYTIGRGYDPGLVSGDRAAASSVELRYGPGPLGDVGARVFAFYDSAWVENLDPGPGSGERTVRSIGGGIRFDLGGTFGLDLAYAHPLDAPVPGGIRPDDRLLVNLITRIR